MRHSGKKGLSCCDRFFGKIHDVESTQRVTCTTLVKIVNLQLGWDKRIKTLAWRKGKKNILYFKYVIPSNPQFIASKSIQTIQS